MTGRDVPLPPVGGRWTRPRSKSLRVDADPVGDDEEACAWVAGWLGRGPVAGAVVAQLGVVCAMLAVGAGGGARATFEWMAHRTVAGVEAPDLTGGLVLAGTAVAALGIALVPATFVAAGFFRGLACAGGWHGRRMLAEVARSLPADAPLDVRWAAVLDREVAASGAPRPESVVRWVRSLRERPPEARRDWMAALRERLKDGVALAQGAIVEGGGLTQVAFAGRSYEAARLVELCRRALDGLRDAA